MPKPEFADVSFEHFYPPAKVADHEIFMSFVNDRDAELFQEWWGLKGAAQFQAWLTKRQD